MGLRSHSMGRGDPARHCLQRAWVDALAYWGRSRFRLRFWVLGLLWPPYMQDPKFSTAQRLVQRVVVTVVGVILLMLAAGHAG